MHRNSRRDLETRSSSSLGFTKAVKNGQNGKGLQAIKDGPKIPEKHMGIHSNKKHNLCHLQLFRNISWEFISPVMAVSDFTSPSDISEKRMAMVSLLSPMICCGIHAIAGSGSTSLWVHLCLIHWPCTLPILSLMINNYFWGGVVCFGGSFYAKDKQTIYKSFVLGGSWEKEEKKIMTNLPCSR